VLQGGNLSLEVCDLNPMLCFAVYPHLIREITFTRELLPLSVDTIVFTFQKGHFLSVLRDEFGEIVQVLV
jgi:hypothetical protein